VPLFLPLRHKKIILAGIGRWLFGAISFLGSEGARRGPFELSHELGGSRRWAVTSEKCPAPSE
jgi:hypothetical protein